MAHSELCLPIRDLMGCYSGFNYKVGELKRVSLLDLNSKYLATILENESGWYPISDRKWIPCGKILAN